MSELLKFYPNNFLDKGPSQQLLNFDCKSLNRLSELTPDDISGHTTSKRIVNFDPHDKSYKAPSQIIVSTDESVDTVDLTLLRCVRRRRSV